jgi:hypothetical protein
LKNYVGKNGWGSEDAYGDALERKTRDHCMLWSFLWINFPFLIK